MTQDRTLFGDGPYPSAGPLAILARVAFLATAAIIVGAVFAPPPLDPHFARSHYLEHFAAFYVALLFGMAALPRSKLWRIFAGYVVFATLLEASHLFQGAPLSPLRDAWVADVGGLCAAAAPAVIERFRRRFLVEGRA